MKRICHFFLLKHFNTKVTGVEHKVLFWLPCTLPGSGTKFFRVNSFFLLKQKCFIRLMPTGSTYKLIITTKNPLILFDFTVITVGDKKKYFELNK